MSDVLTLSFATLRHQLRRYLAPGLAIVLGVAFVASTLVLTSSLSSSITSAMAGQYEPYATVVTGEDDESLPADVAPLVADVDGVDDTDPIRSGLAQVRTTSGEQYAVVTNEASRTPHAVVEGRAPRSAQEVTLSRAAAAQSALSVGDTAPFVGLDRDSERPVTAKVVGLVDVGDDPRYAGGTPVVFATPQGVTTLTGAKGWDEVGVVASGTQTEVTARVAAALGDQDDVVVRSADDHAERQITEITGGTDLLGTFFLAFAVIALFVSAIVIANTFSILLARRSRETAMLRAVGATRGQVVRATLAEALVVGLTASAVGVLAGIEMAWGLMGLANAFAGDTLPTMGLSISAAGVIVPIVLGVVVVLTASLRPVVRSSRVAPLETLRPEAGVTVRSRAGLLRIGVGLVMCLAGAAALVLSATSHSVAVGVVGGLVSFTGVLLAGSVIVPVLARGIGLVAARPFGAPGRLAVDNAVRNPARAAATASALLVGVTLVSMTAVGAATAKSAVTGLVDGLYPVDVVLQAPEVPRSTVTALDAADGIAASAALRSTEVSVTGASVDTTDVVAVPADARVVFRDGGAPSPAAGEVVLSQELADMAGVTSGTPLVLAGPDGRERVTARIDDSAGAGWTVAESTLAGLDAAAPTGAVYLRLSDDADVSAALDGIRSRVADVAGAQVTGAAPMRETNMQALDMALAVVLALLAVSVVIALVGIANTLSLSVIERTRESALLRALGLTRGQLRGMLAIEAVLLAAVGVVLGTVLGSAYALAGVSALLGDFGSIAPALPWGQLAAVLGIALVAGLLASVLPARRAAQVPPAAALAVE